MSTSDLGTVAQTDDGWQLRWERHLPHPVDEVWRTLTDPERVRTWWGVLDADLRVGGRYVMAWQNPGGPTMHAVITACDPPHLLETEGDVHGRLRWELTPDGDGTRLRFTNTLAEPPLREVENLAGWHWHLSALAAALDGVPVDVTGGDMGFWEELRATYLLPALHRRWNDRDAAGFADLFGDGGVTVGFDGSTVVGSTSIAEHLAAIFADHRPAAYVGRVDDARTVAPGVVLVRASVGMVPPGSDQVKADVNAIQTLVVAGGAVELLQSTPAAYHGRPQDVERLTAELQALADARS